MPAMSVMIKPASGMCNMSCDYCFYCDEAKKRETQSYGLMEDKTLKNVIRKTILRAEHMISYVFQGGEPTLRGIDFYKDVIKYQKQYNKRNLRVQNALQTNGYAIDEEWCRFFAENRFLIGLSIDGTANVHDEMRHGKNGERSFQKAERAAKLMDQYGVEYNILTVVTPLVAENVEDIYAYYKQKKWNYQQYIACLEPLGEKHGAWKYSLTGEIYGNFLINIFELWYKDWKQGKEPYIRHIENYIALAAGYMAEACGQRGICGVQTVVEADGSVYPCDFYMLDEYYLGNFNENSLDVINQKRKEIQFIERSLQIDEKCQSCPYRKLCRGGCQRERDYNELTGQYRNYLCKAYQMFFEKCSDRINEIAQDRRRM